MEKQRPNIKEGHPNQDLYKNNTKKTSWNSLRIFINQNPCILFGRALRNRHDYNLDKEMVVFISRFIIKSYCWGLTLY